ncbi:MAG: hypothetical protein ABI548_23410 [Polyangiaceae bacterium]
MKNSIDKSTPETATPQATGLARNALQAARVANEAAQSALATAKHAAEIAVSNLRENPTPENRAALSAVESTLSQEIIIASGATNRVERASAELTQAQTDEQAASLAKRAEQVTAAVFVDKVSPLASKLARARQAVVEFEIEAARLAKGFRVESADVHGAPRVEYSQLFESLVARAADIPAAAILSEVWKASVPAGMSADETLAAAERGVCPVDLQHRINTLRAGEQALGKLALAFLNRAHEQASSRADKATLPLAQLEAGAREVSATRAGLESLGFKAAADAVRSDALASAVLEAGPAAVQAALVELRTAPFLKFDPASDGDTANPLAAYEARKQAQAERAYARLETLCPVVAKLVERPATPAAVVARTTSFAGHDVDVRA